MRRIDSSITFTMRDLSPDLPSVVLAIADDRRGADRNPSSKGGAS
jgi:hypothetical protein